jgi:hypothetical protein
MFDHVSSGRLGGPVVMLAWKSSMTVPVLTEMAPTLTVLVRRFADLVRDARLVGHWRAGDGPERVDDPVPRLRHLVTRKSLTRPSALVPGPSVLRFGTADDVVEPQSSASRVVYRCLEWPQALSGFLKSAATLNNRSGEGELLAVP